MSALLAAACAGPTPAVEDGASTWHGQLSYVAGYKRLESAWSPARDQAQIGLLDLDFRYGDWPVSLVVQTLLSYSSNTPEFPYPDVDNCGTYELNLGVRKFFESGELVPYVAGGVSVIGASVSDWVNFGSGDAANVQEANDSTVGLWVGAGLHIPLTGQLRCGLAIQYSTAEVELLGSELDAGGVSVLASIGTAW